MSCVYSQVYGSYTAPHNQPENFFCNTSHTQAGQGVATRALMKHFLLELQPFVWQLKHDLRGP